MLLQEIKLRLLISLFNINSILNIKWVIVCNSLDDIRVWKFFDSV